MRRFLCALVGLLTVVVSLIVAAPASWASSGVVSVAHAELHRNPSNLRLDFSVASVGTGFRNSDGVCGQNGTTSSCWAVLEIRRASDGGYAAVQTIFVDQSSEPSVSFSGELDFPTADAVRVRVTAFNSSVGFVYSDAVTGADPYPLTPSLSIAGAEPSRDPVSGVLSYDVSTLAVGYRQNDAVCGRNAYTSYCAAQLQVRRRSDGQFVTLTENYLGQSGEPSTRFVGSASVAAFNQYRVRLRAGNSNVPVSDV